MEQTSWIIGGGGFARTIASYLDRHRIMFVVANPEAPDQVSREDFFAMDHNEHTEVFIGVGDNNGRASEFAHIRSMGLRVAHCIAATATVARDASIGEGAVICAGAVIGSRAVVGANTIVNSLSYLGHDCVLGDHSQLTLNVSIAGTVTVGSNCFFGLKSGVYPNLTIGNDVVVMAGSIVTRSLPDAVTVGGVPARIMRREK